MISNKIPILIGSDNAALRDRVAAMSDHVEVITKEQIKAQPGLIARVQAAYGGLGHNQFAQATALRWLQVGGAGVEWLLTPEVKAAKFVITNARGVGAEPITEHMFGMLLMVTRRLAQAWDRQKAGRWDGAALGDRVGLLAGRTLGLLGVGAIGGQSARVGKAFGMRIIGLRRGAEAHPDVERMYAPDTRFEFLAECDVVMNTLPLTDGTRGFLGPAEFAAIRPGVILVNTGRGRTVNTDSLMEALRAGRVGAALLDVTDPEPLPDGHPLWTMENVYITPHYSGSRPDYDERADAIFLENLRRFLADELLVNVVNKDEGY